jgi:hypothetical protein
VLGDDIEDSGVSSRESALGAGWGEDGDPRSNSNCPGPTFLREGTWREHLTWDRIRPKWDHFSWLTVRALFESINDTMAKMKPELVVERRARWASHQRASAVEGSGQRRFKPDFIVDRTGTPNRAFFLIGDTGEQDASQYAVAPYLTGPANSELTPGTGDETQFAVIISDVIYPAGDINEYINGFYIPYERYRPPIYALPGNHDWYDGLNGFMFNFCGADPLPIEHYRANSLKPGTRLIGWLWRGSSAPERNRLDAWRGARRTMEWREDGRREHRHDQGHRGAGLFRRSERGATQDGDPEGLADPPSAPGIQPASYFAIELADLVLVSIDTGITGEIDDEQGRWLLRVSRIPKQKLLLTGKPIYVDNAYHPCEILWGEPRKDLGGQEGFATVDDVIREESFGYIGSIGGDVHNYQYYPVRHTTQRRMLHYFVSGGGGAYLSPTHRIPAIGGPLDRSREEEEKHPWPVHELRMPTEPGPGRSVDPEDHFRCYPLRGDSLAYAARRAGPRFFSLLVGVTAAFCTAAYLYTDALPVRASAQLGSLALYGLPTGILLGLLAYTWASTWLKRRRARGRAEGAPMSEEGETPRAPSSLIPPLPKFLRKFLRPTEGKTAAERDEESKRGTAKVAAIAMAILVFLGGFAWVISLISHQNLLTSVAFWIAIGVSLMAPVMLVAVILVSHDLRGSIPSAAKDLLPGAALISAVWILVPRAPVLGEAPAWFVVTLTSLAAASLITFGVRALRRWAASAPEAGAPYLLNGLLRAAPPAALLVALGIKYGTGWLTEFILGIAFTFVAVWLLAPREETGAPGLHGGWERRIAEIAGFSSIVAWTSIALLLLREIGDGWISNGLIAGASFLVMAIVAIVLMGSAVLTPLKRIGLGLTALIAILAIALSPLHWAWLLAASSLLVVGTALQNWALRSGRLNADRAERYIATALAIEPERPVSGAMLQDRTERELVRLLYPYASADRPGERGPGLETGIPGVAGRLLSELADADQPPFFKNFLRCDVLESNAAEGEPDRTLLVRCFGVTGFQSEEDHPPIEDEVEIPFRSGSSFATWLRSAHGDPHVVRSRRRT